jgi:hypothetical protein
MSWKLELDLKDQTVPTVTLIVSSGPFEVLEESLSSSESLLHIQAGTASEVVNHINSNGIPGMPAPLGVEAILLQDGPITQDNTKLTINRSVPTVDFSQKEDVYKTGIVTGLTSFGQRWALQVTTVNPIDLTKEYPTERVIVEALNNLGPPDLANDFSKIKRKHLSSFALSLFVEIPEPTLSVPSYDPELFSYMGFEIEIVATSENENLSTGELQTSSETYTYESAPVDLIMGRLDYDTLISDTLVEERVIGNFKDTISVDLSMRFIFTYKPGNITFSRKVSRNLDGEKLYRTQVLSGTKVSSVVRKINQAGEFYASQILGDPSLSIEGSDISEEQLFEILASDRVEGQHYSLESTVAPRSTPETPLPASEHISDELPSDYPPGTYDSPSFNSLGERTS